VKRGRLGERAAGLCFKGKDGGLRGG